MSTKKRKFKLFRLFWRSDCPLCPAAKQAAYRLRRAGHEVELFDLDTTEGLAEASFHSVMAVPTMILVDELDKDYDRWVGNMPSLEEFQVAVAVSKR